MESFRNLCPVLGSQLYILLFIRRTHLPQIHKQYFAASVPVCLGRYVLQHCARLFIFIDYPKRYGDIGRIEKVSRQNNDRFHQIVFNEFAPDCKFRPVAGKRAVCKQKSCDAVLRQMRNHMQNPAVVCIACRRHFVPVPTRIVQQFFFSAPCLLIKRRIRHDIVEFFVFMLIVCKRADRFFTQIAADSADRKIHSCKFQSGIRRLLAENCNLLCVAVVCLYKLHRLHKHTARTAARVINFALIRLDKFCDQVDDTFRRIEFALALALLQCKVGKEIFIHPAHYVLLVVLGELYLIYLVQKRGKF